jgi:hypothetical protein
MALTAAPPGTRARADAASPTGVAEVARGALLAGAALYILVYLAIALYRLPYPFELEWIEGGMLEHVRRVLAGEPLYVPPSLDFVPLLYPPLYYHVAAAVTRLVGVELAALRLVSISASLVCLALIFAITHRESGSRTAGFLAAALFAAAFRTGGAWLDLGRVDSLFMAFLLGTVYVVRHGTTTRAALLGAALIVLAYLTKQSALLVAASLAGYALLVRPRFGAQFAAFTALLLGGSLLIGHATTNGWFTYYTWTMPRHHALVQSRYLGFWTEDLLRPFPLAVAAAVTFLIVLARRRDPRVLFHLALLGGTAATSWASRLHSGGYDNVMLVVYAGGAIVAALALHAALTSPRVLASPRRDTLLAGLYGIAAVQFLMLLYNPFSQLPSRADRDAGHALVAAIAELPGDVYLPGHGYLATMAGKRAYAHAAMVTDVLRAVPGAAKDMMATEFGDALRSRRFDAIIMDSEFPPSCPPRGPVVTSINWYCQDIHDHYRADRELIADRSTFWPRTGVHRRPSTLYLPRTAPPADE